jgi:membrane protease YdiL (CAAX protease family)
MNKTVKIILGIVITFFTLAISGVLGMEMTLFFDFLPGFFNQIIILFLASILIYFFNKKGIINFQIGKVTFKNIILPIILTISLLIIAEVIFSNVLGYEVDEHFASSSMSGIQIFFIVVILGSISEELLFRGFLQNMLDPIKSY